MRYVEETICLGSLNVPYHFTVAYFLLFLWFKSYLKKRNHKKTFLFGKSVLFKSIVEKQQRKYMIFVRDRGSFVA